MTNAIMDGTAISDMNGPLIYWGPALAARPGTLLDPSEQRVLLGLRARLNREVTGTETLEAALTTLLTTPAMSVASR